MVGSRSGRPFEVISSRAEICNDTTNLILLYQRERGIEARVYLHHSCLVLSVVCS